MFGRQSQAVFQILILTTVGIYQNQHSPCHRRIKYPLKKLDSKVGMLSHWTVANLHTDFPVRNFLKNGTLKVMLDKTGSLWGKS